MFILQSLIYMSLHEEYFMNGDLANNNQPMNNAGLGIGVGAIANAVVNLYNGNKSREQAGKFREIEQRFQEAEKVKDRALQSHLQKEMRDLQWKMLQENNRVLVDEGNKTRLQRLKEIELNAKYQSHWCLESLLPSDLLNVYKGQSRVPLRIFPVFQGFQDVDLSSSPTEFLQLYYDMGSDRPASVLDGVWNDQFRATLGVAEGLFDPLRSEPILILLIRQKGKSITFGVKYWGCNAPYPFSRYLLTGQDGREVLKYCAEKLQRQGVNSKDLESLALEECGQVMSKCMSLMGAFFADAHFLIYESVTPQLPQLLPQLVRGIGDIPVVRKLVWEMMSTYEVILDKLKGDRDMLVPDLALDMAQALASINPNMARAKLDYALKSWLQLRGVNCDPGSSLIELVGDNVVYGDWNFLQKLRPICISLNKLPFITQKKLSVKYANTNLRKINAINLIKEIFIEFAREQKTSIIILSNVSATNITRFIDYFLTKSDQKSCFHKLNFCDIRSLPGCIGCQLDEFREIVCQQIYEVFPDFNYPDYLFLENHNLISLQYVVDSIRQISVLKEIERFENLSNNIFLDSIITLIDPFTFPLHLGTANHNIDYGRIQYGTNDDLDYEKIIYGDMLLISISDNEFDWFDQKLLDNFEKKILEIKRTARILYSGNGEVPFPLISDMALENMEDYYHLIQDGTISLFGFESSRAFCYEKFVSFLCCQSINNVFKIKGVIWFNQYSHKYLFNLNGSRYSLIQGREWEDNKYNKLVLVGQNLDTKSLDSQLKECLYTN
jgi:G3E family GTPase